MKKAAHLDERVAPAPPSRSAAKESHSFVPVLLSMNGRKVKNQSLWRPIEKSYAEVGTFYVTSITLIGVRFTLLELIGSLSPLEVALITVISDMWATADQLNQMEKFGNETVTKKSELFLENPCKASKESEHDTAENGRAGVKNAALTHSTLDIMAQNTSRTVLGALLPPLSGGRGRNIMGAKKAPSELIGTGGASLCRPSTRGVVKAIPAIQAVRWFPVALLTVADMESVYRCGQIFRGGSLPKTKTGQPLNVVPTFRG